MDINDCLIIAGKAYRQLRSTKAEIASNSDAFPNGAGKIDKSMEIALCEAIISNVRGLLAQQRLELLFQADGEATAHVPNALRGSEYDEGTHYE